MNDNAVSLMHRGVPIAGKPRSHKVFAVSGYSSSFTGAGGGRRPTSAVSLISLPLRIT